MTLDGRHDDYDNYRGEYDIHSPVLPYRTQYYLHICICATAYTVNNEAQRRH